MRQVLVVTFDDAMEAVAALEHLAGCPEREVVVCSNVRGDYRLCCPFFGQVMASKRLRARHRYILLVSTLADIPDDLRKRLRQIDAAVLHKPFDEDTLLATVRDAAGRCVELVGGE